MACALFTLFVFLMSRNPIKCIFNYPTAIIERCDQLELVDLSKRLCETVFYVKKIVAIMIFGVLLSLCVRYVNGCETFHCDALTAYALGVVVNWFDALALHFLWFCHDKHFVIPGTDRRLSRLLVLHQRNVHRVVSEDSRHLGGRRNFEYLIRFYYRR